MAVQVFPEIPFSRGSRLSLRARVLKKSFGDGYEQRAPDGLNPVTRVFDAKFDAVTVADAERIRVFLEGRAGHTPFYFRLPDEAALRQWTCESWSIETVAGALRNVTAKFVEDFAL